jgi:hypothetical protein
MQRGRRKRWVLRPHDAPRVLDQCLEVGEKADRGSVVDARWSMARVSGMLVPTATWSPRTTG